MAQGQRREEVLELARLLLAPFSLPVQVLLRRENTTKRREQRSADFFRSAPCLSMVYTVRDSPHVISGTGIVVAKCATTNDCYPSLLFTSACMHASYNV